ncbi:MAG: winged helix-turn-helix transcriptional regulator, partial [Pirellulaceae bacterium]
HCWRAARWGFHRALRGTQFANTRTPGYVDAMDRIGDSLSAAGCPIVDFQFAYVEQSDLLAKLPDNLRSICEALLVGFTQAEIAAMRGVSVGTVNRRVDELRVFVRALLRAR